MVAMLVGACSSPEDAARTLMPNRVYVERQPAGALNAEEDYVVGLEWELIPLPVRVVPDEAERAWYDEPRAGVDLGGGVQLQTDDEGRVWIGGKGIVIAGLVVAALAALGIIRSRRNRNGGSPAEE